MGQTTFVLQLPGHLQDEKLSWQHNTELCSASYLSPQSSPNILTDALNVTGQSSAHLVERCFDVAAQPGGSRAAKSFCLY